MPIPILVSDPFDRLPEAQPYPLARAPRLLPFQIKTWILETPPPMPHYSARSVNTDFYDCPDALSRALALWLFRRNSKT
jgi:hypothetical protein